jgi:hypothetical protein
METCAWWCVGHHSLAAGGKGLAASHWQERAPRWTADGTEGPGVRVGAIYRIPAISRLEGKGTEIPTPDKARYVK